MSTRITMIAIAGVAVVLLAVLGAGGPPRSSAWVEIQTGTIRLEFAGRESMFALSPDTRCWQDGCPSFAVRARLTGLFAAQRPQGEARRVQSLPPTQFER